MHARNRDHSGRARVIGVIVYSLLLTAVALWPEPIDAGLHDEIARWIWRINALGIEGITYSDIESISNVLLFVPFGALVAMLVRRGSEWTAMIFGLVTSATVETLQWLLLPARVATLDDVVANGVGAAIGAIAVATARVMHRRRHRGVPTIDAG